MHYERTQRVEFSLLRHKRHRSTFSHRHSTLDLRVNKIGAQGAEHLSAALRNNTVSRIFPSSIQIDFFTQTLNTLDLAENQIGDKLMNELDQLIKRNAKS